MEEQAGAAPLEEQQASAVLEQKREDASTLREDGMVMNATGLSVSQLEQTRDTSALSQYAARLGESLSKSKYDSSAAENDSTLLKP